MRYRAKIDTILEADDLEDSMVRLGDQIAAMGRRMRHLNGDFGELCLGHVGGIRVTRVLADGREDPADAMRRRPANFGALSAGEQWEIDKELGILDWDGR